jgi:hypothetical protein
MEIVVVVAGFEAESVEVAHVPPAPQAVPVKSLDLHTNKRTV